MIIAPYTALVIFVSPQNNYQNYSLLDMIEPYNLVPQSGHLQDKTANICMIVHFVALWLSGPTTYLTACRPNNLLSFRIPWIVLDRYSSTPMQLCIYATGFLCTDGQLTMDLNLSPWIV